MKEDELPELPPDPVDEVDESEEEDESSEEEIEVAVTNREKRANAGNRMRALLEDELEVDEMFQEEENDEEFEAKEEEDIFDSDFGSTDSEAGEDEGEDAGEKQLQREAKAERREARGKKKKTHTPFLPQFARQTKHARKPPVASTSAVTLDGDGSALPPPAKKRKVSLANAIAGLTPRESSRKSAVAFKKTIEGRLQESEQRRLSLPKPVKKATASLTQADLIVEALETEEINRASLLAFYAAEEDRRAADRIAGMRYEIIGPKLTFLSRVEGVDRKEKGKEVAIEDEEKTTSAKMESGRRRLIEVIGESGKEGWKPTIEGENAAEAGAIARGELPAASTSTSNPPLATTNGEKVHPVPSTPVVASASPQPPPPTVAAEDPSAPPLASTSTLAAPPPPTRNSSALATPSTEQPYTRNYLILDEYERSKSEEMGVIFGDHHEWGSVKVVPSRSRVLNRKVPMCPITGLPAKYRDPRSFTPYATIAAFHTINQVIDETFVYNETLGAYTGKAGLGMEKEIADANKGRKPPVNKGKAPAALAPAPSTSARPSPAQKPTAAAPSTPVVQENPYGYTYSAGASDRAARRERSRHDEDVNAQAGPSGANGHANGGSGSGTPVPSASVLPATLPPLPTVTPGAPSVVDSPAPASASASASASPAGGTPKPKPKAKPRSRAKPKSKAKANGGSASPAPAAVEGGDANGGEAPGTPA
ncbi:YL1 nuclear family, transcription factor [Pseudohyphozyma bogoriensis]|nr:YL1 nuclear family, transcription factor [Pseudohyphozyma bogoriensis]